MTNQASSSTVANSASQLAVAFDCGLIVGVLELALPMELLSGLPGLVAVPGLRATDIASVPLSVAGLATALAEVDIDAGLYDAEPPRDGVSPGSAWGWEA